MLASVFATSGSTTGAAAAEAAAAVDVAIVASMPTLAIAGGGGI